MRKEEDNKSIKVLHNVLYLRCMAKAGWSHFLSAGTLPEAALGPCEEARSKRETAALA